MTTPTFRETSPELRRFMVLLAVRAMVVLALLASTVFFNLQRGQSGLSLTQVVLYGVAGFVLGLTLWSALWLKRIVRHLAFHVQVQILSDLLIATLLVYITGGVESPFTFFYALPIIYMAIFFPRRHAILTAGLGALLLASVFILEHQGILPIDLEGRINLPPSGLKVAYQLAFNFAVFFAIAFLAGTLGEQLRQAGRELQKSEEEVQALVALNRDIVISLRSGLMALDAEGQVSLMNPMAEIILGQRADQALGRPGTEVFPPLSDMHVDADALPSTEPQRGLCPQPNSTRQCTGAGENLRAARGFSEVVVQRFEAEHARPDGGTIPVGLTLSPLSRPDGVRAGTLVHMQDLTSIKALQETMKRSERMAALGGMAAVIAHEIRNPLASLSGAVQLLQKQAAGPEQRLLGIIVRETERLNSLLCDFLAFARPKPPHRARVDLARLTAEVIESFRERPGGSKSEVTADLRSAEVEIDENQIRQVLWNLLINADQALEDGGRIDVRVHPDEGGKAAILEVQDNGPGIDAALRERIFDPFFTTREQGTGLGLAIVQQIVQSHGSRVELGEPAGGGSLFRVRLG